MSLQTLAIAAVLLLLAAVGTMDYQDAMSEQAHYCDMVSTGAWPDFRNIFDEVCDG